MRVNRIFIKVCCNKSLIIYLSKGMVIIFSSRDSIKGKAMMVSTLAMITTQRVYKNSKTTTTDSMSNTNINSSSRYRKQTE